MQDSGRGQVLIIKHVLCVMPGNVHNKMPCIKAWSHRGTDIQRGENGQTCAEFGYPVTKFISSAARGSRDRYVGIEAKQWPNECRKCNGKNAHLPDMYLIINGRLMDITVRVTDLFRLKRRCNG